MGAKCEVEILETLITKLLARNVNLKQVGSGHVNF